MDTIDKLVEDLEKYEGLVSLKKEWDENRSRDRQTAPELVKEVEKAVPTATVDELAKITDHIRDTAVTGYNVGPAPYKLAPKTEYLFPVTDFDPDKQAFPCTCYVHQGQFINRHHVDGCGQMQYDSLDQQSLVTGPEYTSVVIWQKHNLLRKVQGLAQVKSEDPVAFAQQQLREAAKYPREGGIVAISSGPADTTPYVRPALYPKTTKFVADWEEKTKWQRYLHKAAAFALRAFFAALAFFNWKPKDVAPRWVVLSKVDVTNRLREYTADPKISKADRELIYGMYGKSPVKYDMAALQDILRTTSGLSFNRTTLPSWMEREVKVEALTERDPKLSDTASQAR